MKLNHLVRYPAPVLAKAKKKQKQNREKSGSNTEKIFQRGFITVQDSHRRAGNVVRPRGKRGDKNEGSQRRDIGIQIMTPCRTPGPMIYFSNQTVVIVYRQIEIDQSNPTIATIWRIANGLKVPFTALLREEAQKTIIRGLKQDPPRL